MIYNEYIPSAPLAGLVKCIWSLQMNDVPGERLPEKILPDGCMELIFNYGDRYRQYGTDNNNWLQPQSFIHGQMKSYIAIAPTGNTGIIAARFYPHGLSAFINAPASILTEQVVDTPALFGPAAKDMEEKLGNAPSENERLMLLNEFLVKQLKPADPKRRIMAHAVNTIAQAGGNVRINQLAVSACMSERQFERTFLATVGLTAKTFSKITRFQYSIKNVQQGQQASLTRLAIECGYYDQAHFIRDFREYAGINPVQYFSDIHPMSDLFTGS